MSQTNCLKKIWLTLYGTNHSSQYLFVLTFSIGWITCISISTCDHIIWSEKFSLTTPVYYIYVKICSYSCIYRNYVMWPWNIFIDKTWVVKTYTCYTNYNNYRIRKFIIIVYRGRYTMVFFFGGGFIKHFCKTTFLTYFNELKTDKD